jgi:hypothetical protein
MLERYPAPSFKHFGTNWDKILAKMAYLSVINEIGIGTSTLKAESLMNRLQKLKIGLNRAVGRSGFEPLKA